MLAGGVVLYGTNEFLVVSMLPSVVNEIGGDRVYSWATTLYLVGSVVAAATVNGVHRRIGPRRAYFVGLAAFFSGCVVCASAPGFGVLLAGRTLQGIGGGLLAGLGYALINTLLPATLWTRASGLISAMWGVGTLAGPTLGGGFAQIGAWRWSFGLMAVLSAATAVLVAVVLTPAQREPRGEPLRIPVRSLLLLGAAAVVVSAAQLPHRVILATAVLAVGGLLLVVFVVVDRQETTAVLPRSVFHPGREKWIYLALGALMAITKANLYVPLFGERLAHMSVATAGFLGAALSTGWMISEVASASLNRRRLITGLVAFAPLVVSAALLVAANTRMTHYDPNPTPVKTIWAVALLVVGLGVGAGWPHLSAWAMSSVDDPAEGATAAAAINTVQLISGAFGAGIAGWVMNTALSAGMQAARTLFAVFAVFALLSCVITYLASRGSAEKLEAVEAAEVAG